MYPVSDKFLQEIDSNSRNYYWTGTITTKSKKTYDFGNEDVVKGSGYITRSCCGSSEIELGSVYAAEMGLSLFSTIDRYTLDGAEVKIFFHLVFSDKTEEIIPMGVFEITEANRHLKTIEIKGYDHMLRFDKKLNLESSSGTPYNFLNVICNTCKVEMAQTQAEIDALTNGKETLGLYADNDIETYRDLLFYVAQVLGCVCQINREGKLELIPYGNDPIRTVEAKHRYDSSFSDFVTRYTAISSTNKIKEESEYYALEQDDGLTMNLGVNPLLQFGLKATRARLLNAILKAVSVVEYVPFDSNTIGNPALDPMDCLVFSGGHADETKVSCITSITYRINGKHVLKCVGKNPKLAEAKSKNDKNISGLLNQVEEKKTVVYDFVNVSPYEIFDTFVEVVDITFVSKETTSAMFLAEVLVDMTADEMVENITGNVLSDEDDTGKEKEVYFSINTKTHPILEVMYKINGNEVEDFHPTQICHEGKQMITLFFPLSCVQENCENTFTMWLKVDGGSGKIGEKQIRATLSGQGLVAGVGEWNGRITITDSFDRINLVDQEFKVKRFTSNTKVTMPKSTKSMVTQGLGRIQFAEWPFGYELLNERVTCFEVVHTFTLDKDFPGEFDKRYIELSKENNYQMISTYTYLSTEEEIGYGTLQVLNIDTTQFERVEKMEVSICES